MTTRVDTIAIGGGMAGLPMALRSARNGKTILVEGDLLGGTCLNRGCVPTKTMIHYAKVAHLARRAADFGVRVGEVTVDLEPTPVVRSVQRHRIRSADRLSTSNEGATR